MDKKIRKTHQSESEQKQSDKNQDIPDLKKTQRRARRTKVILSSVSVKQRFGRLVQTDWKLIPAKQKSNLSKVKNQRNQSKLEKIRKSIGVKSGNQN